MIQYSYFYLNINLKTVIRRNIIERRASSYERFFFFFLQEGVQELQVPARGAPAGIHGGGRSLGTRPGSGSADGDGHGVPERRRRRATPGAVQEPGASRPGRPGAPGGADAASPEALAERRR